LITGLFNVVPFDVCIQLHQQLGCYVSSGLSDFGVIKKKTGETKVRLMFIIINKRYMQFNVLLISSIFARNQSTIDDSERTDSWQD
jgi:hypothetical protein